MTPIAYGARMPGKVATVFEIPKRVPAKGGAMSTWLTITPGYWNPLKPTPRVSSTMATYGVAQEM
jgi:hypothetical protein